MPRLSVDIDVVFTDHTLDRASALQAIAADLKVVKSAISAMGYRAALPTTKSGEDVKLLVENNDIQLRVEVNFVFRGTVLPVSKRQLVPMAQEIFT
ncbi:MAG TPA: nucleotidyl transferase AbiEii/AbiGii toxin family protein, partial [Steroidobacteraceae bacterium]